MRDNLFEGCGDTPQSFNQADLVRVGSFAIDIETPVEIEYDKNGKDFRWRTMMYVEDGLGVNDDDLMAKIPSMKEWAPRRRVKRAKWDIAGSGSYSGPKPFPRHKVVPGDTLSGLARKYYGDAKLWPILYKFNQEAIGQDPALLKVGMVLEIPDLDQLSPGMKEQAIRELTPSTPGAKVIPAPPLR
jgi:hypothetical protein